MYSDTLHDTYCTTYDKDMLYVCLEYIYLFLLLRLNNYQVSSAEEIFSSAESLWLITLIQIKLILDLDYDFKSLSLSFSLSPSLVSSPLLCMSL